jgi:hypothetical protein
VLELDRARGKRTRRAIERSIIGIDHHTAGKRVGGAVASSRQRIQDVMWLHSQPTASLPDRATTRNLDRGGDRLPRRSAGSSTSGGRASTASRMPTALDLRRRGVDQNNARVDLPELHEEVADRSQRPAPRRARPDTQLLLQSIAAANQQAQRASTATLRAALAAGVSS